MIIFDYNEIISVNKEYDLIIGKRLPVLNGLPLHITTSSSENAIFLIRAISLHIIKIYNIIENIYMSTYNINQNAIRLLEDLSHSGNISGTINVLFNDSVKRLDLDRYNMITDALSSVPDMIYYSMSNNHSKMQLISGGGNYFVVEGSGNLASNSNSEQYTIFNSFELFDFRKNMIMSQFDQQSLSRSAEASNSVANKFNHIGIR